tara:strand:- start:1584 stop:1958 length:375 start_codon:yes stop_codon:yes gene_type:complete
MTRKQFLARVKAFIAQNDLDLQHAVLLLGGAPALTRLQRFRRALNTSSNKSIRLRRELTWLHDLLSLEHVGDFDADEAGHFAMIDPADPVVWSICTLTEAVADLIDGLDELRAASGDLDGEVAA